MFNLLTFVIGTIVTFLIARYNKSNKLFWTLFISMILGFVGGSIGSRMVNASKNKVETTQFDPTQAPSVLIARYAGIASEESYDGIRVGNNTPKPASQIRTVSDVASIFDPNTDIFESDVGNLYKYFNTS